LDNNEKIASLILTAGRGSRFNEYSGNKTLLPLVPGNSVFEGSHPILLNILKNLPPGPKALVVNHKKEDIIEATIHLKLTYCIQPVLNGTGGALLASRDFLDREEYEKIIITMGDIPFVNRSIYIALIEKLKNYNLVVLGFRPKSKKQYGLLEIDRENVRKIVEWKYWNQFSKKRQGELQICNSGIYASRKKDLLKYLSALSVKPHIVRKKINGKIMEKEEYFITDLVEYMYEDGLSTGYIIAEDEKEVMGIDDISALINAQKIFRETISVRNPEMNLPPQL